MICIITVICTFISNPPPSEPWTFQRERKIGTCSSVIFSSLSAPILALRLCHASFRCNLYISRVFSMLFTPPPSSRLSVQTRDTRDHWIISFVLEATRPSVFRVPQPLFLLHNPSLDLLLFEIWMAVCKVGISSRSRINVLNTVHVFILG